MFVILQFLIFFYFRLNNTDLPVGNQLEQLSSEKNV